MKSFVVFAAVVACAMAKPQVVAVNPWGFHQAAAAWPFAYHHVPAAVSYTAAATPVVATAPVVAAHTVVAPVATKTQYHAQDELGQYSHGYAHPGQAAAETRDAFGNVRGSYAYVDPNGKEVRVNYIADAVNGFRVESNALPVGPAATLVGPAPVVDTPEVVLARAEHARLFAAAAQAAALQPERRKKRAIFATSPVAAYTTAGFPAVHYTTGVSAVHHPVAYSVAAPAVHYTGVAPVAYHAAPAVHYTAAGVAPVAYTTTAALGYRPATLTTVHNNPGHAVSYRVD